MCICVCVCVCVYTVFSTSELSILFTNLFFYQYHIDLIIVTFGVCWYLTKIMKDFYEECVCISHSVMFDSLRPHGLSPSRLLCPWNSSVKNTAVGSVSLPTGLPDPGLLHFRQILYHMSYQGSPFMRNERQSFSSTVFIVSSLIFYL